MSEDSERSEEALLEARAVASLLEAVEERIKEKGQSWSEHFQEMVGQAAHSGGDPTLNEVMGGGRFTRSLQEIIPALKQAERTGKGLELQKIRIIEAMREFGVMAPLEKGAS
ncbi:MAG TPA: hypothetical protein VIF43_02280 [Patescibacteria group bacterium]|jgi:hypothetical protein